MNKLVGPVLVVALLGACTSDVTESVTLRLADADGNPVTNARLICHDDGSVLGDTNAEGMLTLQVPGENRPGQGFVPDCKVAYFRTDNDQFGRHFWFERFVLGENVNAKAHSVERVEQTD